MNADSLPWTTSQSYSNDFTVSPPSEYLWNTPNYWSLLEKCQAVRSRTDSDTTTRRHTNWDATERPTTPRVTDNDTGRFSCMFPSFCPLVTTEKQLTRSKCRWGWWWLGWAQGMGCMCAPGITYCLGVHIGITWQIRLNDCARRLSAAIDAACSQITSDNLVIWLTHRQTRS